MILGTSRSNWHHVFTLALTLTYFMSIYFATPGDNNYPNLLVKYTFTLKC